MSWASHVGVWGHCTRCQLHVERKHVVLGMGRIPNDRMPGAPFMVVGQWPGQDEDISGLPMQGAGGRWTHWAIVQVAKIPWDECFFTNVLGCKPKTTPGREILQACDRRLDDLLLIVQPKIIIAMGLVATRRFSRDNKAKMGELAGTRSSYKQVPLFYTTHPFEPARVAPSQHEESKDQVTRDFEALRRYALELSLLEREEE